VLEHTRVVPAQIVSETVDWVKAELGEPPSRFVNAVLRRAVSVLRSGSAFAELEAKDPASWNSLPLWAWDRLVEGRGEEFARAYGSASLARPTLWLREKSETGGIPREAPSAGNIESMPGFAEGKWIVQDISNQRLVERVAGALRAAGLPNARVLDLCSAPGGKSIALAWEGFQMTATEIDEAREKLLDSSLARAGLTGKIERLSWGNAEASRTWDAVWVDAPCTSFGILRRHPEIRWRKTARDLASIVKVQADLLAQGYARVKPGGFLFYSVCSPFLEECEAVLETLRPLSAWEDVFLSSPADEPFGDALFSARLRKPV
jgi:16S rRNA (cytosine967-C5)-methyltransferase